MSEINKWRTYRYQSRNTHTLAVSYELSISLGFLNEYEYISNGEIK